MVCYLAGLNKAGRIDTHGEARHGGMKSNEKNHAEQIFQPLESVLVEQNLAAGLGLEIRIRAKICSPVQNRSPVGNRAFLSRTRQLMPIRRVHKRVQMLMLLNHSILVGEKSSTPCHVLNKKDSLQTSLTRQDDSTHQSFLCLNLRSGSSMSSSSSPCKKWEAIGAAGESSHIEQPDSHKN